MLKSKYQAIAVEKARKYAKHPLDTAGIYSRLFFTWVTDLMALGNERQLDSSDLWPLQAEMSSDAVTREFEPKYNELKSVIKTALSIFKYRVLFIGVLRFAAMLASLYGPIVLHQVVSSVESNTADFQTLSISSLILFVVNVGQAVVQTQSDLHTEIMYLKFKSALQNLLYKKILVLNAKSRKVKSAGEVANLFTSDISQLLSVSYVANEIWIVPVKIIALLYMLWQILGWAMLTGFGVIFVVVLLNRFLASAMKAIWKQLMEKKDVRMKVVNEVFGSIQIIKFNTWEERYYEKIRTLRDDELNSLWMRALIQASTTSMNYIAPVALTTVSFASYVLLFGQTLTATKLFTALSIFGLIKQPMTKLPQVITTWMQALVSYKRLTEFLALEERDPNAVTSVVSSNDIGVEITNGSFGWDIQNPFFQNLNLTIKRGEFVVLHGSVGEGKSSLCNVILGELEKYEGSVGVNGRIAYFSQQPWIQNMTIRENILFGLPYDRVKYNKVIEACALEKDLTHFAAGDRTEIGTKGVNVSGGQKARISLARACYSDADIYILDSPLSAVDAIVQNEIFTKCLLGLLRHKTILLVTHNPEIISSPYVDKVIEVKNGKQVETARESKKDECPVLISPLKARPMYIDESEPHTSVQPNAVENCLVSPYLKSPFIDMGEFMFTPEDESEEITFSEVDTSGKLVVAEERKEGRASSEVFFAYFNAMGGWPVVTALLISQCIFQSLQIFSDLWLSAWTSSSSLVAPEEFHSRAQYNILVYASLALSSSIMVAFRSITVSWAGLRASKQLFVNLCRALLGAPMRFFDTNPLGRILNRFSGDINKVDTSIPGCINSCLASIFFLLFTWGTTIIVVRWIGPVLLPLMWIYFKVGTFFVQPARELERLTRTARSPMVMHISESIDGAVVLRAFGPKQIRRFERIHHTNVDLDNETNFSWDLSEHWFRVRIGMISAGLILVTSFSLITMRQYLTAGLIGLVFSYSLQFTSTLESLVWAWSMFETAMIAPERVAEYTNVEQEATRIIPASVSSSWPQDGSIQFHNVSFRYKPTDPLVLKNITFQVRSGEKVGIVGRTGAGKSSLTMALFRINDIVSGTMKISGINTSNIGIKTLRESMVIIPQNPILFKGTLRHYLDPFDQYTDAELWDVLNKVRLTTRISSEPDKLLSIVQENGDNYSVGERQMLCMARALLRQCRIVIMDEATAAIDHETDQNLQRVIREEFASSTVLTIAHRLDTVLDNDRILVFDQGTIVQNDTPANLIQVGSGIFYNLCQEGGYLEKIVNG
ncbi:unnamed protein product [Aphanomyces euteiches]